jgi:transposase
VNIIIPSTRSLRLAVPSDATAYKRRNMVERFFHKLQRLRGIAARHDKLASNFRAPPYSLPQHSLHPIDDTS